MGADARTDGALAGVVAVCAALATVVLCGSALDRWRRRQVYGSRELSIGCLFEKHEGYDRLSGGGSERR